MRHSPTSWPLLAPLLALTLAACDVVDVAPLPRQPDQTRPPVAAGPTQAPQPTALPAPALLANALEQRALGEYDGAAQSLHTLLTAHPDAPEARDAHFYLAESFALRGRWTSAIEALRAFLDDGTQDDLSARALFWLARGYEEAGAWGAAVDTYDRYLALDTPLAPYARMRQAAQYQALGQLDQAAAGYEAVGASEIMRGERAGSYLKAIALRRQLGQNDQALQLYARLLEVSERPVDRAPILAEAAALAAQLGDVERARVWLREIVERSPEMPQALDAVAQLAADPQGGLAPAAAALVYDLHEQPGNAVPFYDAALAASTGDEALDLRRRRALALRASGDFAGAMAELATIGAVAPDSEAGRQAQLDWVQTLGQSGDTLGAADGYRQFAQAYPADPRAPEALSRAIILLGRLGDAEGAAQQQLDLGRRYPDSPQAHAALDGAGWYFHGAGRPAEALAAWELLGRSASGATAAQAAFWAARSARQVGQDDRPLLELAQQVAPDSYYGFRAAELLDLPIPTGIPIGAATSNQEWRAAEDWIAGWSGQPAYYVDEKGFPADVVESGPIPRAVALTQVGLPVDAIAEWNEARSIWSEDPVKLYLLARQASQHNVPYIGLKAAEDLIALAPAEAGAPPDALQRLVFPTPYSTILLAQASEFDLDPRALYAMIRQESLFNPGATSWVGARGLAQVMPATAEGIAQNLQVADFDVADLYRPAVSIRFGAFYLSRQLAMMNGSLQAALSAYNGGPGNAQRWANGTVVADPDVFAETIDYHETRHYVKLVYGYYGAYQRLYAWP